MLEEGHKITYEIVTDYWKDTGTPEDIIHANKVILENMKPYFYGKKENNVLVEGNVMIGKKTSIKSGSIIKGPVIIGENCQIEKGVKIGPNTSIGDNSIIKQGDIENSIIMDNCEIDSNIKIRNSIIAFYSKILTKRVNDEKTFLLGEGSQISV